VRRYALDDVTEVDGISQRLMGAPFALAGMAPRRYERLVTAGPATGVLESILVRAYLRMGAALPRQAASQHASQEVIEGGAVYLFAEGIAEHVVKADVASLYPSLMITESLSPASDTLGALLSVLGRLTDLRLAHKAAARSAAAGSREARSHEATNLAMKIIINAAYGYMGAGRIALFADARAAALVTRRGREILAQVLDALRKWGMTLIEADSDGVYFAVPATWQEEDERALVAEIAAELPPKIVLEYDKDSRAAAMFSHEVKNYALLKYDGTLVVRGTALRSSRNEPFGVRFLRRALVCSMTGDVVSVRTAFLETVEALRARKLPATDVATRVRLSKTPQEYLARRSSHVEPQYEALLSAGRTSWTPGEQVRFYRAREGKAAWLPDKTDEFEEDENQEVVNGQGVSAQSQALPRDYDVDYYLQLLLSYAERLRKAFSPEDYSQIFRLDGQAGLFDRPIETIQPRWIRCTLDQPREKA
jgi:DNA polymerase I